MKEEEPTAWFEPLYREAEVSGKGVPWAHMETHPSFRAWLRGHHLEGRGKKALVVGCGMGDDAIELVSSGFDVTAFDVSPSAIARCRQRFPQAPVDWIVADLLAANKLWIARFDFVLEIYTIQALPPKYEEEVIGKIAGYVAPGGELLVIAVVGVEPRTFDNGPPWVLTQTHVETFQRLGLEITDQFQQEGASRHGRDILVTTFHRPASRP